MTEVTKVELYKDNAKEYRWRAFSRNGEEITKSSEGYEHKRWAHSIARALFADAEIVEVEGD